jgi:hypothetical protein
MLKKNIAVFGSVWDSRLTGGIHIALLMHAPGKLHSNPSWISWSCYRQQAPTLWCPECHTALAQADVDDLARTTEFYTLDFRLPDGKTLPIATTRPELLPACVAIFIHPEDGRFTSLVGKEAIVPFFRQRVPILEIPWQILKRVPAR